MKDRKRYFIFIFRPSPFCMKAGVFDWKDCNASFFKLFFKVEINACYEFI